MGDNIQDTQTLIQQEDLSNAQTTSDLCKQYVNYVQFNIPLPRYTPISPYGRKQPYTKYDLDMRRKAEILKYKSLSIQDNGTTKAQKLSFLFNNTTRLKHIVDRSKTCDNKISSSTACDVPGPPINLYLDNKVPLYNYIKTYTFGNSSDSVKILNWDIDTGEDVPFYNNVIENSFSIIYNSTKNGFTTYSFQTPIAVYIEGKKNQGLPFTAVKKISVQIVHVNLAVLYSNKSIKYLTTPIVTHPKNSTVEIELPDYSTSFSASKYIGAVTVSNLKLITQNQYVYDICYKFTLKTTLYDSMGAVISGQSDTTVTGSLTVNLGGSSDPFYLYQDGCTITNPALPVAVPFNVTSIPPNVVCN